jgi:hypothetical protein
VIESPGVELLNGTCNDKWTSIPLIIELMFTPAGILVVAAEPIAAAAILSESAASFRNQRDLL